MSKKLKKPEKFAHEITIKQCAGSHPEPIYKTLKFVQITLKLFYHTQKRNHKIEFEL